MTTTLSTILISGASEELTQRIEQLIRSQAELSLVKRVSPGAAINEEFKAKLIWIELESDPDSNIALLEQLIKSHPNSFFVVSKEDLEPELVKKAMQVGALDFLDHKGWAAQIRSVVRRIMAKEFGAKPAQSSAMSAASRGQSTRQSSWAQLNSLKVSPSTSGFRRVEPNKPTPQPQGTPAATPEPAAPPPPPPKAPEPEPEPEPEVVEREETEGEIEAAPVADEEAAAEGSDDEKSYAEQGEREYASEEQGYAQQGEHSSEEGYAEQSEYEKGYTEEDVEQAEGEYAGEEQGYAVAHGESAAEVQDFAEQPEAEYESQSETWAGHGAEEDGTGQESDAEDTGETAAESPLEEDGQSVLPEEGPEEIDTTSGAESEPEPATMPEVPPPKPAPAAKGRWDELDSIISQKSDDKEGAGKWGDLSSIPTPKAVQKDMSTTQATGKAASKWGDLDSIGIPAAKEAPASLEHDAAASAGGKWDDLDLIGGNKTAANEPAAPAASKWGDLDAIGSGQSANEPASPAKNKWGDLDAIGSGQSASEPASPARNKWGDLDSIGAPKPFKQDAPETGGGGAGKWGDLDSIQAKKADVEPAEGSSSNKWGSLDSIGSKGGGLKSNTRSFIKPKVDDQSAGAGNAAGKGAGATGNSKWGDLDAIGGGQPASESATTGGAGQWGELDAIGTPGAGKQVDEAGKWGNLNAIPTPKSEQTTSAQWANLDSIPTPKATPDVPTLIEGALPTSQATNEASQKWKSGMSSDLSTGARQVGEMRDKLKGRKFTFTIGWENVNIVIAVAIIASVGWLGTQFFTYPEPPAQAAGR